MMRSNVKIGATAVSPKEAQKFAEDSYRKGFFCCEAVMETMKEIFKLDVSDQTIAMASAMSIGAGRSGCMCGALNGAILALGMFFGRTEPRGPKDPEVNQVMALSNELHNWFRDNNGKHAVCCRVLTREFDMGKGEHREQCIRLTSLAAYKLTEIIAREMELTNLDEVA